MALEVSPGNFYLGREFDPKTNQVDSTKPVLYKAAHLTTHAVCVGMTGSGKTGLCIDLLEEAALNGLPSIIIDPKGDMGNLLLTFPNLQPADFQPWINPDDAQRAGMTEADYAAKTAAQWSKGLADWDEDGARIQRLRDSAEFVIYTPGSKAGLPVNVLHSFDAPDLSWDTEEESLRELIASTVSALLGLLGIEADPIRSREHILLSNIIEYAWRRQDNLDLARLIGFIQKPPMSK
ncbi:MAG: helicase HerA domain-containing protein, partial [Anaerolineae bacterium]